MSLKRIVFFTCALALWLLAVQGIATALMKDWLKAGDPLPDVTLTGPENPALREYLGLSGEGPFRIPDIKAEVVIVELFSLYCPHCRKEAPSVNTLYEMIEEHPLAKGRVKLIGIGIGNDPFAVNLFRKNHEVPFPLFDDADYSKHEACGGPGTPFFFIVKNSKDGSSDVVLIQLGGFENPESFLQTVIDQTGLE